MSEGVVRKVLVTGSSGFVGGAIARGLIDAGYEVVGCGRTKPLACSYRFRVCDISQKDQVDCLFREEGIDAAVHAAACLSGDCAELYRTNVAGTANVIDGCANSDVKVLVYISSIPIVGRQDVPIDENMPPSPAIPYHLSKAAGELLMQRAQGFRSVILRLASPVGLGMPNGKIFSTFVRNAVNNVDIDIAGDGRRVQNYVSVGDVAEAVKAGLACGSLSGIYNLNGESISDADLAKLCVLMTASRSRINILNSGTTSERWFVDGTKIKEVCGFQSRRKVADVIREMSKGMEKGL